MQDSIQVILGTPRSGLYVLMQCLELKGIRSLDADAQIKAVTINDLIFQDLGIDPFSPTLPLKWLKSAAATKAKERIHQLLDNVLCTTSDTISRPVFDSSKFHYIFISNPLFSDLWQSVFSDISISPHYVLIVRHPHEVALSLKAIYNINLTQGHILWLAHTRAALRSLEGQDYSSTTFDQLLADPVSTLTQLTNFSFIAQYSLLLNFVQPSLRNCHASNLVDAEKEKFNIYAKLYDQIRALQFDKKSFLVKQSEYDLIDSLLQALCKHDFSSFRLTHHSSLSTNSSHYSSACPTKRLQRSFRRILPEGFSLYATIVFPSSNNNNRIFTTIPLLENQWQKISMPLSSLHLSKTCTFQFFPINKPGSVLISSIKLVDRNGVDVLWQCSDADSFSRLRITGQARIISHRNNLFLAVFGNDVSINIDFVDIYKNCPMEVSIWIKASANTNALDSLLDNSFFLPSSNALSISMQLASVLKTMTNLGLFHQNYKDRSDEFKKISTKNDKSLITSKTFWGKSMYLFPRNEVVSSKIFSFGLFESEICSFFCDFLFQNAIVLDVGAHIGFFSMLSSELIGSTGKVFAFEPTPSTREVLKLNLKPYNQSFIVSKLAWHENVELDFQDFGIEYSAYNTARTNRLTPKQELYTKVILIKVETTTLDDFCRQQDIRPDLIKIDAESSEMEVLKGMTRLLDKLRPVVIIEVGDMDKTLKAGVPLSCKILDFTMSYDYIPIRPVAGRYESHEVKERYTYDNIIMVPREKLPTRRPLGTVVVQRGRFF